MRQFLEDKSVQDLIKKCAYKAYNKFYVILKNRAMDYDDFVQEIFLRLLSIKVDKDRFNNSFLVLTVYSKIKSILSKRGGTTLIDIDPPSIVPPDRLDIYIMLIEDNFSDNESKALIYKIFYSYSFEQLAAVLNCSRQNVFYTYNKALKKLQLLFNLSDSL